MMGELALQLQGLCEGVLLGGLAGLLYDGGRLIRRRFPRPRVGAAVDLAFWSGCTTLFFLWSRQAWRGVIRWYGPIFCLIGGALYLLGLSPWVLNMGMWAMTLGETLLRILLSPLRAGYDRIKVFKKFQKTLFIRGKKVYDKE